VQKNLIITADGSHSIEIQSLKVTYHSIHGAIQESRHVFIEAGLNEILSRLTSQTLYILEMGLGTGLNAFLTAIEAEKQTTDIQYTVVEQYPLPLEETKALNYTEQLGHKELFSKIHESNWEEDVAISRYFTLQKEKADINNYSSGKQFHLIYYDAFAPDVQPELWTRTIFENLFLMLRPNGILVTYCSKGDVRRAMMAVGFNVKKLPGPKGKREMLRATKSG
jgi:tRNA U34 5-methylaminomethyl-2-thiouridine-forming methyltransferase MnmC